MNDLLVDCDNHCYEPPDTFVSYIDPALRERAVRTVRDADGMHVEADGTRIVFLEGHQPPGKVRRQFIEMVDDDGGFKAGDGFGRIAEFNGNDG